MDGAHRQAVCSWLPSCVAGAPAACLKPKQHALTLELKNVDCPTALSASSCALRLWLHSSSAAPAYTCHSLSSSGRMPRTSKYLQHTRMHTHTHRSNPTAPGAHARTHRRTTHTSFVMWHHECPTCCPPAAAKGPAPPSAWGTCALAYVQHTTRQFGKQTRASLCKHYTHTANAPAPVRTAPTRRRTLT